jgi:hypothetical protein
MTAEERAGRGMPRRSHQLAEERAGARKPREPLPNAAQVQVRAQWAEELFKLVNVSCTTGEERSGRGMPRSSHQKSRSRPRRARRPLGCEGWGGAR